MKNLPIRPYNKRFITPSRCSRKIASSDAGLIFAWKMPGYYNLKSIGFTLDNINLIIELE